MSRPISPALLPPPRSPNPAWTASAACRNHPDPDLWFPEYGDHDPQPQALRICRTCPVRTPCLRYIFTLPHPQHGIWGGTTPRERTRILATISKETTR